jgi:hypothetical protein
MAEQAIWGQTYKVLLDTGFTTTAFILGSSTLDGSDVLDGNVEFADVTEWVTSVNIKRGRPDQLSTMPIGQASIVLDDQASGRRFDPANTASPYFQGTYGISPMRYVQVYGGTAGDRPLFFGRIADVDVEYEQPNQSFTYVACVDDLAQLARTNLTAFNPSSQLSSARVSAILDRPEVSYSTATRSIGTGVATLGTVAYDNNDNVKAAIDAAVQAEDGRFFISAGGTATFQSRLSNVFGTAVASFGDNGGTAIGYQALSVGYGAETLFNRVQVGVQGLSVATAVGTASIAEFGIQTLALSDVPLADLAAGTTLANNLLDKYQDPVFRFDELTLTLNGMTASQAQQVSTIEIGQIVNVTKSYTTGSPTTLARDMVVERITHSITPMTHRVTLGLGQTSLKTEFILNTSVLDDVEVGLG